MRLGAFLVDRRPLAVPEFRRLWTASVVTAVGGSFTTIAVPTQLFAMTGSSATVGLASAVVLVALVASGLLSGALADAMDRRRLLLTGHGLLGLAYLGLSLQSILRLESVPGVLVCVLAQGIGFGTTMTAMGAAVPRVVPSDLLVAANGLSSLTRYGGAVIGPLVVGLLIPAVGLGPLYLLDTLALTVVLWAVARLPPMPPLAGRPAAAPRDVIDGVRYLAGQRILVAIIAVDLAAMVLALPIALFPELAAVEYGPTSLGPLFAAFPAGVFLAGLASATVSRVRAHGAMMAGAALAWGVCVIVLAVASRLWLALVALVLGGVANFVLSTFRRTISQVYTDDALLGRIQGILTVVLVGGPSVGNVAHGVGGALLGPRWTIGIGGALAVAAVVLVLWRTPELWRYRPVAEAPSPVAAARGAVTA